MMRMALYRVSTAHEAGPGILKMALLLSISPV